MSSVDVALGVVRRRDTLCATRVTYTLGHATQPTSRVARQRELVLTRL